jgi:hypothetical protein
MIAALLFFGYSAAVSAQVRDTDISTTVNPEMPGPIQNVDISITSFATDLDKAQIVWVLNGQIVLSGVGKKSFSFKTGESGSPSTIDIGINIVGLPAISKRIIIQPGEVDMLWEATDSYVPPFYRGKALPSQEGEIKVVAMPNIKTPSGEKLKDNDFSYNWSRNFNADPGLSGYAKRSYLFKNDYLEAEENISVSVSSVLGNYSAEGKVLITPGAPKIDFYERDPALGIKYGSSLMNGFNLGTRPLLITAVPYFFSSKNIDDPDFKYSWSINGQAVETTGKNHELAIKSDKTGGASDIGLSIESLSKIFQKATATFEVTY